MGEICPRCTMHNLRRHRACRTRRLDVAGLGKSKSGNSPAMPAEEYHLSTDAKQTGLRTANLIAPETQDFECESRSVSTGSGCARSYSALHRNDDGGGDVNFCSAFCTASAGVGPLAANLREVAAATRFDIWLPQRRQVPILNLGEPTDPLRVPGLPNRS